MDGDGNIEQYNDFIFQLHLIFDRIKLCVSLLKPITCNGKHDFMIMYVNTALADLWNKQREDIIGSTLLSNNVKDIDNFIDKCWNIAENGGYISFSDFITDEDIIRSYHVIQILPGTALVIFHKLECFHYNEESSGLVLLSATDALKVIYISSSLLKQLKYNSIEDFQNNDTGMQHFYPEDVNAFMDKLFSSRHIHMLSSFSNIMHIENNQGEFKSFLFVCYSNNYIERGKYIIAIVSDISALLTFYSIKNKYIANANDLIDKGKLKFFTQYQVNIDSGQYYSRIQSPYYKDIIPSTGNFHEFLQKFMSSAIHPEDRRDIIQDLETTNFLSKTEEQYGIKVNLYQFRCFFNNEYIWMEAIVKWSASDANSIYYTIYEINRDKQLKVNMTEHMLYANSLCNILGSLFTCVFAIDFTTNEIMNVVSSENLCFLKNNSKKWDSKIIAEKYVHIDDRKQFIMCFNQDYFLSNSQSVCGYYKYSHHFRFLRNDGKYHWMGVSLICSADNRDFFFCAINDIDMFIVRQQLLEDRLKVVTESQNLFFEQLHSINPMSYDYDIVKDILYFVIHKIGRPAKLVTIEHFFQNSILNDYIYFADKEYYYEIIKNATNHSIHSFCDYRANYLSTGFRWYRNTYNSLCDFDGKVFRIIGTINEISTQSLDLIGNVKDVLTGVWQRNSAIKYVNDYLKVHDKKCRFAFLLIDIADFSSINDKYGYDIGDKVLITFSLLLKKIFNGNDDYIARLSGDIFCVFIPECDRKTAVLKSEIFKINLSSDDFMSEVKGVTCDIGLVTDENFSYNDFGNLYELAEMDMFKTHDLAASFVSGFENYNSRLENLIVKIFDSNNANYSVKFDYLSQLNLLLSNVRGDEVGITVNRLLSIIGEYYKLSRVYLVTVNYDQKCFDVVNEWCNEEIQDGKLHQNRDFDAVIDFYIKKTNNNDVLLSLNTDSNREKFDLMIDPDNVISTMQYIIKENRRITNIYCLDDCMFSDRIWKRSQICSLQIVFYMLNYFVHYSSFIYNVNGMIQKDNDEHCTNDVLNSLYDVSKLDMLPFSFSVLHRVIIDEQSKYYVAYSSPKRKNDFSDSSEILSVNKKIVAKQMENILVLDEYVKQNNTGQNHLSYYCVDAVTKKYSNFIVNLLPNNDLCVVMMPFDESDTSSSFCVIEKPIDIENRYDKRFTYFGNNLLKWLGYNTNEEIVNECGDNIFNVIDNTELFVKNNISSGNNVFKFKTHSGNFCWIFVKKLCQFINSKGDMNFIYNCYNINDFMPSIVNNYSLLRNLLDYLSLQYSNILFIDIASLTYKVAYCDDKIKSCFMHSNGKFYDLVPYFIKHFVYKDDVNALYDFIDIDRFVGESLNEGKLKTATIHWRSLNGDTYRWIETKLVWFINSESVIVLSKDIDKIKRQELNQMSLQKDQQEDENIIPMQIKDVNVNIDHISGLMTFTLFKDKVNKILSNVFNEKNNYYFVNLDINNFGSINEMYGFENANSILKTIGKKILELLMDYEVACRLEADEFDMLLSDSNIDTIKNRIQNSFNDVNIFINNNKISLLLSIGIYPIKDYSVTVRQMGDYARLAKITVKGNYYNNIAVFDESMNTEKLTSHNFNASISRALSQYEFKVWYQAQFSAENEKVVGAEALVRWIRPDGSIMYPDMFIPTFEKSHLIINLDWYVYEQVCVFIRNRLEKYNSCPCIAVNFSRIHIFDDNFIKRLDALSNKYSVPHKLLCVEITETIALSDFGKIKTFIDILHAKGYKVSIDDFGSGHTVISMLSDYAFDVLKFDRSLFVDSDNYYRKLLLGAIAGFCRSKGITIVAEGIETHVQMSMCNELHLDVIQGFLFSKPISEEAFSKLLKLKFE